MHKGNLPPQAYTRDVLAHAFSWLQTQPESTKKMVQNPDSLVAIYLKAKRNGEVHLDSDAPVSTEAFRNHLKALANEMQQFVPEETYQSPPPQQHIPPPPPMMHNSPPASFALPYEDMREEMSRRPPPTPNAAYGTGPQPSGPGLDARSLEMIHKVKNHLNLSTDQEAVRALIVLGFDRFQSLFR